MKNLTTVCLDAFPASVFFHLLLKAVVSLAATFDLCGLLTKNPNH